MDYQEQSFLGSGDLNLDILDSDGNPTGEIDFGNCTIFAINAPSNEKKTLKGFRRENYAETIKDIITGKEQEIKITTTDVTRKSLALAASGSEAAFSQTAGSNTASPESVTAHLDKWAKLAGRNLDAENPPVVKDSTDTTTYDEGDDYEIDYITGRIMPLTGGEISEGDALHVGSTWLAITGGYRIDAGTLNRIEVKIRLLSKDISNSRNFEVIVYKVALELSGDINWLSEEFAQLDFVGKIESTPSGTWAIYDLGTFA